MNMHGELFLMYIATLISACGSCGLAGALILAYIENRKRITTMEARMRKVIVQRQALMNPVSWADIALIVRFAVSVEATQRRLMPKDVAAIHDEVARKYFRQRGIKRVQYLSFADEGIL